MLDIGKAIPTGSTIPQGNPEGSTILSGHFTVVTEETAVAAKRQAGGVSQKLSKGRGWEGESGESQYYDGGTTREIY